MKTMRVVSVEKVAGGAVLTMECGHTCSTSQGDNRRGEYIPCLACDGKAKRQDAASTMKRPVMGLRIARGGA